MCWRFLGISEVPLALFSQEQPCRNPQQHPQCGQTRCGLEDTRSRDKNAFIPQKSHYLMTIWAKSQIFTNTWVWPAHKEMPLSWCGVNPCEKSSQRALAVSRGHLPDAGYLCAVHTSVHAGDNTGNFFHSATGKVPPSRTSAGNRDGQHRPHWCFQIDLIHDLREKHLSCA